MLNKILLLTDVKKTPVVMKPQKMNVNVKFTC